MSKCSQQNVIQLLVLIVTIIKKGDYENRSEFIQTRYVVSGRFHPGASLGKTLSSYHSVNCALEKSHMLTNGNRLAEPLKLLFQYFII